jgi:RNA 3'-terminal phosphate cyclase (ATP)
VLLPLILADVRSRITIVGGTHVPWSPPVHYLTEVFLPAVATVGVRAPATLRRWGWYPAGGGELEATIERATHLGGLNAEMAPAPHEIAGLSAVSRLPRSIAERQRRRAEERLRAAGLSASIAIEEDRGASGPGTLLFLAVRGRAGFSAPSKSPMPPWTSSLPGTPAERRSTSTSPISWSRFWLSAGRVRRSRVRG